MSSKSRIKSFGNIFDMVERDDKDLTRVQSKLAVEGYSNVLSAKETRYIQKLEEHLNFKEEFFR